MLGRGFISEFGETSGPRCFPIQLCSQKDALSSWGLRCPQSLLREMTWGTPHGARPTHTSPSPADLPQECHVVLGVNWVAEDVAFQGGHRLLEPEKEGVAGAQADLERDGQR